MMAHAECHSTMAPEQYGSCKNISAIMHAVNKVLSFDIIWQYKIPAMMCSNNAKSCYDHVVHSVASLCFQHQGIQEPPLVCLFSTLQKIEHTIHTAYGDSECSYSRDLWVVPLPGMAMGDKDQGPQLGLGQGNGAAPTGWAVVSTLMLDIMWKQGHCTVFKALISDMEIKFVGFVDDKDLLNAGHVGDGGTYQSISTEMQQGLDLWEGLLKVTGGALVPAKSFWYLIDFQWMEDRWHYATWKLALLILSYFYRRLIRKHKLDNFFV